MVSVPSIVCINTDVQRAPRGPEAQEEGGGGEAGGGGRRGRRRRARVRRVGAALRAVRRDVHGRRRLRGARARHQAPEGGQAAHHARQAHTFHRAHQDTARLVLLWWNLIISDCVNSLNLSDFYF